MRIVSSSLLLVTIVAGCTSADGNRALWARACEYRNQTQLTGMTQQECLDDLDSQPSSVADDIARCTLKMPAEGSDDVKEAAFDACIRPQTRAHFDAQREVWLKVEEIGEMIEAYKTEQGAPPPELSDVVDPIPVDPWGRPLKYDLDGGRYTLCSLGADGWHGTSDDYCYRPYHFFIF